MFAAFFSSNIKLKRLNINKPNKGSTPFDRAKHKYQHYLLRHFEKCGRKFVAFLTAVHLQSRIMQFGQL